MTCKDCIHWKACRNTAYEYTGEDAASAYDEDGCCKQFAEICENFADKSEWVHLPCKVFEDVYLIHNGSIERCVVEGIHYTKKSSYVRLRPYHQNYLGNWSKYLTPSIHSFVKTAFLTREEAEKALKDMRKASNGGRKANDL